MAYVWLLVITAGIIFIIRKYRQSDTYAEEQQHAYISKNIISAATNFLSEPLLDNACTFLTKKEFQILVEDAGSEVMLREAAVSLHRQGIRQMTIEQWRTFIGAHKRAWQRMGDSATYDFRRAEMVFEKEACESRYCPVHGSYTHIIE